VLGQGTWGVAEHPAERHEEIAALRVGLDLGMTLIDTAETYADGGAERLVAEALAGRRDEAFIVTKVLPANVERHRTIESCEASLRRLNTDRIDLYLLHWREPVTPLDELLAAFERLVQAGKIRSWGVSNFDVSDLEEVLAIGGEGGPVCNQILYHLRERAVEHAVLPWCEKHGLAVVGYSPFGHGDFPGPDTVGGRVLGRIAHAHHATPRQVALRFLVRRPELFTIPKASSPEHVAENARAGDIRLTEAEIEEIDRAFPLGRRPSVLPTL